jgi:NADPH2:quinone reductase
VAQPAGERQVSMRRAAPLSAAENTALVRDILSDAAAGRVRPVIGQELDLAHAAEAHAAIEARATTGKTLLTVA